MCDCGARWGIKEGGGGGGGRSDGIEGRVGLDVGVDVDDGGRSETSGEVNRISPRFCFCPRLYTYLLLGT